MKQFLILFSFMLFGRSYAQILTPYERGNGNQSATFEEMRAYYQELARKYTTIHYETRGEDDNNKPIDVVVFNPFGKTLEVARGREVHFIGQQWYSSWRARRY